MRHIDGVRNVVEYRASLLVFSLLVALCGLGGFGLGFCLRGGNLSVLAPIALLPQYWAIFGRHSGLENAVASASFGLSFYGTAFQGLLGPWDGAFGAMWMLLTISFVVLHTSICGVSQKCAGKLGDYACWLFPFGVVAYEYGRHLLTKMYDGCGLTFCLIGQSWVEQSILLQSADIGGVWWLSFLVAFCTLTLAHSVSIRSKNKCHYRLILTSAFIGTTILVLFYGNVQSRSKQGKTVGHVAVVPERMTPKSIQNCRRLLETNIPSGTSIHADDTWRCIVYPETCMIWSTGNGTILESSNETQNALLKLTHDFRCFAIIGAWVHSVDSKDPRNTAVVVYDGNVLAIVDKQHPAPFVEGRPFGTKWFIHSGIVPVIATRNVAKPLPIETRSWKIERTPVIPSVCYDLFFPQTYRRFPITDESAIICCLDESFDGNGVFQQLSHVHTRLRAVELRRPVVRCSFNGLSGVFDSIGETKKPLASIGKLHLYEITGDTRKSFYAIYGDWFPQICCAVSLVFAIVAMFKNENMSVSEVVDGEQNA